MKLMLIVFACGILSSAAVFFSLNARRLEQPQDVADLILLALEGVTHV